MAHFFNINYPTYKGKNMTVRYKVDEYHANVRFAIDHFNTSTNVGGFYGLTGSVEFDQAKRDGKIDITIPVANLQSGSQHFTGHLKSADIFDAAQYPDIRFVSTKFNFNGKKLVSVDGNLTMRGKTAPVKLKAEKFNCYQSPMAETESNTIYWATARFPPKCIGASTPCAPLKTLKSPHKKFPTCRSLSAVW